MGQQQLLLVILVTILVGIATVVAINVFGTAAEEANRDAVRQELLAAGAGAQAVWTKPELLDGAGRDFDNFTEPLELLRRLGLPARCGTDLGADGTPLADASGCENENGQYQLAITGADDISITGYPANSADNEIILRVYREQGNWLTEFTDSE